MAIGLQLPTVSKNENLLVGCFIRKRWIIFIEYLGIFCWQAFHCISQDKKEWEFQYFLSFFTQFLCTLWPKRFFIFRAMEEMDTTKSTTPEIDLLIQTKNNICWQLVTISTYETKLFLANKNLMPVYKVISTQNRPWILQNNFFYKSI